MTRIFQPVVRATTGPHTAHLLSLTHRGEQNPSKIHLFSAIYRGYARHSIYKDQLGAHLVSPTKIIPAKVVVINKQHGVLK